MKAQRNTMGFNEALSQEIEARFDTKWEAALKDERELSDEAIDDGAQSFSSSMLEKYRKLRYISWLEYFTSSNSRGILLLLAPRFPHWSQLDAAALAQGLSPESQAMELHMLAKDTAPVGSFVMLPLPKLFEEEVVKANRSVEGGGFELSAARAFSSWMTCRHLFDEKNGAVAPQRGTRLRKKFRVE